MHNTCRAIAKGDQINLSIVEKPTIDVYKKFDFSVSEITYFVAHTDVIMIENLFCLTL